MAVHEVQPFLRELSAKLATRSRHVCAFLGAGASRACGLPDMAALEGRILEQLNEQDRPALERLRGGGRNVEQVLSRLRRIAVLLEDGSGQVDELTADQSRNLDRTICGIIVDALSVDDSNSCPDAQLRLVGWRERTITYLSRFSR